MTPEEAVHKLEKIQESQRERTKKYYEKNKDKCREYGKEYYRKKKEMIEQAKQILANHIQDSSENLVV